MQEALKEDDSLWRRFKEGNDYAFYRLYDQYADNLYRYGSHFSKDKDFIKDCIHDLFLELYKYWEKLSGTDNIQFYLYRSLRRIIHKGQVKVIPLVYDEMINSQYDSPVFSYEDCLIVTESEAEDHKVLHAVMKTLPNRQREALSLKFELDRSYPEIAEMMGISVESAHTIIYRTLKELRKCFEDKNLNIQLLFFISCYPPP